ncbi:MAG: efflux RND transporter periplasmic adaptor subunit [Lysobacterales bacterium]
MSDYIRLSFLCIFCLVLGACDPDRSGATSLVPEHDGQAMEFERGPHGGRILKDGDFALELAIFETGVPPEYRAWATTAGKPTDPQDVNLEVRLTRLGNRVDRIKFQPQDDFLRGDQVVYEPHSFVVSIEAGVGEATHRWEYENFEGRTRIDAEIAEASALATEIAGPAEIHETIEVYGRIEPNAERVSTVTARFEGLIQSVHASLGETVKAGQPLLTVESDESLKPYVIKAPISGTVTERNANAGEPTAGRRLFTIIDPSSVWVNLAVFPSALRQVQVGAPVTVFPASEGSVVTGEIDRMNIVADGNQAVMARVTLDNTEGRFFPGSYIQAEIQVATYTVPLAVRRKGLQAFRDFTVVYAQIGDEYEVRMLELGRQDDEWVEVLGGLDPGTRYVTTNSYLVKADIEKSGASHDH